uniref:ORF43 n=1 Tax=Malaco herpesvirus 4 TaxID=3031800 RepID=A0AA48P821_9VIRU|nr:TPA_asm: ORF43 [Malaco herpesvirus 4]
MIFTGSISLSSSGEYDSSLRPKLFSMRVRNVLIMFEYGSSKSLSRRRMNSDTKHRLSDLHCNVTAFSAFNMLDLKSITLLCVQLPERNNVGISVCTRGLFTMRATRHINNSYRSNNTSAFLPASSIKCWFFMNRWLHSLPTPEVRDGLLLFLNL